MKRLWTHALAALSQGLSVEAQELLYSMGFHEDAFSREGLASFASKKSLHTCPRITLEVKALQVRWAHAGVRVNLQSTELVVNGLPVATIKLCTDSAHKKGKAYAGLKKFFVRFDHRRAVKKDVPSSDVNSKEASAVLVKDPL